MTKSDSAASAAPQRARWVRPVVRLLNANHALISTRPDNEDGAFSTS